MSAPCLQLRDPDGEVEVAMDASEEAKAVGCILTRTDIQSSSVQEAESASA